MKIAFIVQHLSNYRLLGPVIDRALEAGLEVECWPDYSRPATSAKGYLFPAATGLPAFLHGRPKVQSYASPQELVRRLERGDADAVMALTPLRYDTKGAALSRRPVSVTLQCGGDTFHFASDHLADSDLLALYSPWWLDWGAAHLGVVEGISDVPVLRARLESRSQYVGYSGGEAVRLVDRDAVRRRWGIPAGQPVVVLLPFPQGVGRRSFWPKRIFSEPSRVRRLFNVVAERQFGYLSEAWGAQNDVDVTRAARKFCDRHGAFLLAKSRKKTPIPSHVSAVADKCLYDESFYPSTIIEALSIADLCIHYYSLGVLEATALGVPSFCIASRAEDYFGTHASRSDLFWFESFFHRRPDSLFEFDGVSRTVSAGEAIAALSTLTLGDFKIDARDGEKYRQKFLGDNDGRAAARTLAAIERAVASTDGRMRRSAAATT